MNQVSPKEPEKEKKIFSSRKDLIQHYSLSLLIKKTYSIELCCYLLGTSFLKYSIKIVYYLFFLLYTFWHNFGYGQYHHLFAQDSV